MQIAHLFLLFMIYSFVGWAYEVLLCSATERSFVNRGFLFGPYCPIYGVGALIFIYVLEGARQNPVLLFFSSMILASALEYTTSLLLEKLFGAKLWDYSHYKINLNGRISLLASTAFGLFAVLLVFTLHPFVERMLTPLSDLSVVLFSLALMMVFLMDMVVSVKQMIAFTSLLKQIEEAVEKSTKQIKDTVQVKIESGKTFLKALPQSIELPKINFEHIFRAFPRIKSIQYTESLNKLLEHLAQGKESLAKVIGRRNNDE